MRRPRHVIRPSGRDTNETRPHFSFKLAGNHISGCDEKDSSALSLASDPLGRTKQSVYRGNTFDRCTRVVPDSQKPLWEAAKTQGNVFIDCGPEKAGAPQAQTPNSELK